MVKTKFRAVSVAVHMGPHSEEKGPTAAGTMGTAMAAVGAPRPVVDPGPATETTESRRSARRRRNNGAKLVAHYTGHAGPGL